MIQQPKKFRPKACRMNVFYVSTIQSIFKPLDRLPLMRPEEPKCLSLGFNHYCKISGCNKDSGLMACSNPSVTILSKQACVPQVIKHLSLSLWTTWANAPLDSAFSSNPNKPQAPFMWWGSDTASWCVNWIQSHSFQPAPSFEDWYFLKWSAIMCLKTCLSLPRTMAGLLKAVPSPYKFLPSSLLIGCSEIVDFHLSWRTCSKYEASLAF